MSSERDGGPAFPNEPRKIQDGNMGYVWDGMPGMSMRQYYKAAALLYIAAKANDWQDEPYIVAGTCGRYADAMLAEDEEHAKKRPLHPAMNDQSQSP